MTVEEGWKAVGESEPRDQFPVGMRVLVVDDDNTCLRVLERLLRQCEYHVTTTTQAITALSLLRENRNKFDLVISDVHMPDMDGFKLLELVGLEMDLPVIMMSGNGDTKNVMKGVTHGACDYLLKPVRIEELKNIWQHVIRRKKSDPRGPNNQDNSEKPRGGTSEGGQGSSAQHGDRNRKRKDQDEDEFEDDDLDESGQENEDPSAQKRPRVVWSVELHRKFVTAVNQLGIDKAVPKKILDLMNVEKLTRENVASHLQKYRLYLKRISSVTSQQANMVAALGGKDTTYLRMASLDGMGDFHALTGSGHLSNSAFPSFTPSGMLGRLNTPAGLGLRGLASSGVIQLGHSMNSNSSFSDLGKLQSSVLPGSQHGNLLNGIPTSLELNHLQQNKFISRSGEFIPIIDQAMFPLSGSGFSDAGMRIGNTNSFVNSSNSQLLLKENIQQVQNQGCFVNQSSVSMSSVSSEPFEIGNGVSTQLPDNGRCAENRQGAVTLTGFVATTLPLSGPFSYADLPPGNIRNTVASVPSNIRNNSIDTSSNNVVSLPFHDSGRDPHLQGASVCIKGQLDNNRPSTFGSIGNRVSSNMKYTMQQNREDSRQDYLHNSTIVYNSTNSSLPVHGTLGSFGQNFGKENAISSNKKDSPLFSQSNSNNPYLMQHNGFDNSSLESVLMLKGEYQMDQTKSHGGFTDNSSGSLEDLMHAMIKREEQQDFMFMDGDGGCNIHPVRTLNRSSKDYFLGFSGLSLAQAQSLEAELTEHEVWNVVSKMKHGMSPGPDGYTVEFFQNLWDVIKHDFMEIVTIFSTGSFLNWRVYCVFPGSLPKEAGARRV